MIYSLYMYTNKINGKRYIGVTNNLVQRHRQHAKGVSGARLFNRAVKKYGIETFDFNILALFDLVRAADYHEHAAIQKFGTLSPLGYNLCEGAPGTPYHGAHSEETRAKMSVALLGNTRSKGKPSSFLGRHHSAKTRALMSESRLGNTNSKGHHPSPETRAKISVAMKGRVISLITRGKMSVARKRREAAKKGLH